ncbi:MAG: glycosyltransferase family 4 protein [Candidatus Marinimicrobia bacterium]|nr:glycosyltransferase family 4 protein [Candidatus Neomarinimicrobiota bacterium]
MRIFHIVPGSGGGFYCQNCVRDVGLARAQHGAGHEVLFVPMYLPFMEMADGAVPQAPVFYGAVNVYLEQKTPLYPRLPPAWRRRLDAPGILRWAAGKAGTTQAGGLGDMTYSVLAGRDGRQRGELDQMIAWMQTQPPPDIIHISNALLLGLAPALREAFPARIVCTLQDEDTWLDALPAPWRERCWDQIKELARHVAGFIPVSATYAALMQPRLALPDAQCRMIPLGIDTDAFAPPPAPPSVPTLGFLSELTPPYGLDVLAEAFIALRRRPELAHLRLRVTGGRLDARTGFLRRVQARIEAAGLGAAVDFVEAYREPLRSEFLRSLSVLSVPARRPEAFGLFQIEAMACGVPVVQPRLGAYPEIVQATGGGVIYDDRSPEGLVKALHPLLTEPELAARYGRAGRAAVVASYSLPRLVVDMDRFYCELLA